ncbi:DUF5984 family protein [Embleya sp. NPDC001921]
MLRFRFVLRPLCDVRPWGEDVPRLGWFILTDGWYWIELGGHELLRYAERSPGPRSSPPAGCAEPREPGGLDAYVDYHVVRLWEDLVELMPRVLEPVPPDLLDFVAGAIPDAGRPRASEAPEAEAARYWHAGHALGMGHLSAAPDIRFRRTLSDDADTMTVTWAHAADPDDEDPIAFTAPPTGRVTFPTEAFIAAVTTFDRELFAAMEQRVAGFEASGPPAGVDVDPRALRREQLDRATWLRRAMSRRADTDWSAVRMGAALLRASAGGPG